MENRKINRRIKAVFRTCLEQWKGELLTPRTYMGYLVGISMVLIIAGNYMGYANGRNVQIFEPVIIALSDPSYSIFIMLGLLLTLLDAPFIQCKNALSCYKRQPEELVQRYIVLYVYANYSLLCSYICGYSGHRILANVSAQQLERDGIPAGDTASDGCAGNMGP